LTQRITLGSLFDGIGGFPYAASFYGIKTLWASEIIPAAISVTKRHFPDIDHVGDITKLNGAELAPVDIISFGSPCQSFSMAGQRQGLEGKSGLFWEAIRIIREMREATNGEYPKYSIFENVPGILSANKGRDYQTVLEAFTEAAVPMPSTGKWTNAGMVRGGRIDVAWVIHDAQYFGVAQRRRRLFAVCDFRGQRAAEILFKPKSLHRYFTQGSAAGKRTAAYAPGSVRIAGAAGNCDIGFDGYNSDVTGTLAATLGVNCGMSTGRNGVLQTTVTVLNDQGGESLTVEKSEISPTLRSEAHGNLPIVSVKEVYPINTQIATRHIELGKNTGLGIGENGDPAYTLQEAHSHAVAVGINGDVAGTLDSNYHKGAGNRGGVEREVVLCRATGQSNSETLIDKSATLNCNCEQPIICMASTQINAECCKNLCPTITEAAGKSGNNKPYVVLGVNQNALGIYQHPEGDVRMSNTAYSLTTASSASARNAPLICAFSLDSAESNSMKSKNPHSGCRMTETARTLDTTNPCPSKNQGGIAIVAEAPNDLNPPVCGTLCAKSIAPNGIGNETDMCIVQKSKCAYGFDLQQITSKANRSQLKEVQPVLCQSGMPHIVIKDTDSDVDRLGTAYSMSMGNYMSPVLDKAPTLIAGAYKDRPFIACENDSGIADADYQCPARSGYIVRRLTPGECEALQGYPRGYTAFGHDGTPLSDTARYQALGNSVAIPCVAYVISGIVDELSNENELDEGGRQ